MLCEDLQLLYWQLSPKVAMCNPNQPQLGFFWVAGFITITTGQKLSSLPPLWGEKRQSLLWPTLGVAQYLLLSGGL